MLSLTLLLLYFFLFMRPSHGQLHMHTYLSPLPYVFFFSLLGNLSTRRIHLPPIPSCLTSLSWGYISPFCMHSHCHMLPFALFFFFIIIHSSFFSSSPFSFCFQAGPGPLSVYHPTSEEVSAAMGTPIEGFFNGVDIMAEAMAFTPTVA